MAATASVREKDPEASSALLRLTVRYNADSDGHPASARQSLEAESEADAILAREWPEELPKADDATSGSGSPTAYVRTAWQREPDKLVRLNPPAQPRQFEMLQQWEGTVIDVENNGASVELADLRNKMAPKEIATVPLVEFSKADLPLLGPGCVFYWAIGFEQSRGGQIRRVSEIRVRRTPKWTKWRIEQLKREADDIYKQLNS